ncbi:hypothetical protein Syun_009580 [Stephania yunnanensis]|uniref:Cytochrome P450 n=1 Tax=Stephania yunnanensis TaxID=152371 RepID=A0AAP0PSE9_9MAGN
MHLQLGELPTVVVATADLAQEVFKTHDLLFLYRPQSQTTKIVCYDWNDLAFAPYGDYRRELRKICTLQLLSSKRVNLEVLSMIIGLEPKLEKLHRIHDKIFDDIIRENLENKGKFANERSSEFEEDLVEVLITLQEGTELQTQIAMDNIKAVIMDIFIAGTETSSSIVEWAMAEMMRNQRVLKEAQTEVRRAMQGKAAVDEAEIQELTYVKSVIKETPRLHPSLPLLLPRKCREACEISGYVIRKEPKDPKSWPDAESIVTERFDGISADFNGNNFEFIPFGAGRRICHGVSFGMANIELMLAHLLYCFDWELPYGIKSEELDMKESFGSTVRRQNDLYLIPTPYCPSLEK